MAEVSIREHTRRGKGGKIIHVHGYTRRVGHKGVHSPKRDRKKEGEGKEIEEKIQEKKFKEEQPKMSPEEYKKKLKERMDWEASYKRAEEERTSLGMSKEQYSYYKFKQQKKADSEKKSKPHVQKVANPLSNKGTMTIMSRIEDKIASFVDKYSKKKYKRYL